MASLLLGFPSAFGADLLVKFRNDPEVRMGRHPAHADEAVVKKVFPRLGWERISVPDAAAMVERYRRHPDVLWAEVSRPVRKLATPNDARYPELWGLNRIGAPAAWNSTTGDASVVVGVVDTGIDYTHPDLNFNLWRNPGEIPGNSLDDDGNGYADDVHGIDVIENDGDPRDDDGHGTHVAGTIGAVGNNATGVTGLNWSVSLMALRIGRADQFGETADIMEAFDYAVAMKQRGVNLRVLNNSWGNDFPSAAIREAFRIASAAGILLVCAAGNSGLDSDHFPGFPATFDAPGVISVAASDEADEPASFTNYGRETVHLAAPGVSILSTLKGGPWYASFQGTSMASPHVAGAAALLLAKRPDLTRDQLKSVLMDSVDRLPAWETRVVSGGRLNLARAMERVSGAAPIPQQPSVKPAPKPSGSRPEGPAIVLASRTQGGAFGSDSSYTPSLSADGRWVAFSSLATNLVAIGGNGREQVYLLDLERNTMTLVSASAAGVPGNRDSSYPSVSRDGRFVVFESEASNLVADDGNRTMSDVFLFDREAGTLTLISRSSPGSMANGPSGLPVVSADGRWVAYMSAADNLTADDAGFEFDIFLYDRLGRENLRRVSASKLGTAFDGENFAPSISADGRYVAFSSDGQLLGDDRNNREDVYVHDRVEDSLERISVSSTGAGGNGNSSYPVVSGDGRRVAFISNAANLTGSALGEDQVMLRDRVLRTTTLVSKNLSGRASASSAFLPAISGDGRVVAFASDARDLEKRSSSIFSQLYLYDVLTESLGPISFNPIGNPGGESSLFPSLSHDGRWFAFQSRGFNLVPGDGNAASDVFLIDRGGSLPDLSIALDPGGAEDGGGVVHPGVVQRAEARPQVPGAMRFRARLSNLGTSAESFTLRSHGLPPGWTVIGQHGTSTTSLPLGAGWMTPRLGPGESLTVSLQMTPAFGVDSVTALMDLDVLDGSGRTRDAVRLVVTPSVSPPGFALISSASDGTPGELESRGAMLNGDGSRVVFQSEAATLVDGDENFYSDVFLHNHTSGRIELVSATQAGAIGNGPSDTPSISSNGLAVAFSSRADNLVTGDRNEVVDVFVKDMATRRVRRVSVGSAGQEATRGSENPALSGDGRFVVFQSMAPDLAAGDFNDAWDVFLHDLNTSSTRCLSLTPGQRTGAGESTNPEISHDGRWVVFDSRASDLVPNDENNESDAFLVDTQSGVVRLISRRAGGGSAAGASAILSLSADGSLVLFSSSAKDLDGPSAASGLYLFHRETGRSEAVSPLIPGFNGDPGFQGSALSPDGRFIAMNTRVPGVLRGDTNLFVDAFVYDRTKGVVEPISVPVTGHRLHGASVGARFNSTGRFVVFRSESPAVLGEGFSQVSQVFLHDRASFDASVSIPLGERNLFLPMERTLSVPISLPVAPGQPLLVPLSLLLEGSFPDQIQFGLLSDSSMSLRISQEGVVQATLSAGAVKTWTAPVLDPGRKWELVVEMPSPLESKADYQLLISSQSDRSRFLTLVFQPFADADKDGTSDAWELATFGGLTVSAQATDTDRDGLSNSAELAAGTDPLSGASRFEMTPVSEESGALLIRWKSALGRRYIVERAVNGAVDFAPVSGILPATEPINEWRDTFVPEGPVFYRVRLLF